MFQINSHPYQDSERLVTLAHATPLASFSTVLSLHAAEHIPDAEHALAFPCCSLCWDALPPGILGPPPRFISFAHTPSRLRNRP